MGVAGEQNGRAGNFLDKRWSKRLCGVVCLVCTAIYTGLAELNQQRITTSGWIYLFSLEFDNLRTVSTEISPSLRSSLYTHR